MAPFLALGKNALFIFVVSQLLTKVLYVARIPWRMFAGKSLHFWLFDGVFGFVGDRYVASIAWAVGLLAVLTAAAMVMDRRGIVIRL